MGGPGSPEPASKKLGETIGRLRTKRSWSRSKLLRKIYGKLGEDDETSISEETIKDLEEGIKVKVTRRLIELLMDGLECNLAERLEILEAADRNVLVDGSNQSGPESEFFHTFVRKILYDPIARAMLRPMLQDKKVETLNLKEMMNILNTIVDLTDPLHDTASSQSSSQTKVRAQSGR